MRNGLLFPVILEGYLDVDLGATSAFNDLEGIQFLEGTDVARWQETIQNHSKSVHRYLVSHTVLDADVLVSLPKLKFDYKVGITIKDPERNGRH